MNLEEYRTLFIVATLGLALVVASPALAIVLPQVNSEEFSEFWLVGPNHKTEGYPFNVGVGEEYKVFVGVSNHVGSSENYIVYVKFRNSAQSLPDTDNSVPSSLPPLYEYRLFVGNEEAWESPVTFGFEDTSVEGDVLSVGNVIINGVVFPVDASAVWDSDDGGFFFQLFFELWHYDVMSNSFRFDNRYAGIWLNMTASD